MLGINSMALNAYQSEKNMISKSLERISDFKKDTEYFEMDLQERETQADTYLAELPVLMNGMFDALDNMVLE